MKIENPNPITWHFSERAAQMQSSFIREILKVTQRPEIISFAGGLPSADTFPVEEMKAAFDKVLSNNGKVALQYGPTDGFPPLREWIANSLSTAGCTDRPRTGVDDLRLAAGARPARQGADRRRQPRAGRDPELPRRAAGVFRVPPGIRLGRHRRAWPGAELDREGRQGRAHAVRAAELPEPDRPQPVGRAPPRTGRDLRPPQPAADRGRSVRRAELQGRAVSRRC